MQNKASTTTCLIETSTWYTNMFLRLASEVEDYKKCDRVHKAPKGHPYDFPTILAERSSHGILEGFLSTDMTQNRIICGPLWLDQSLPLIRRSRITIRLLDAYEMILKNAGVTQYLFNAPPEGHWLDTIERAIGLKPYEFNDGAFWYKKEIR
jgi:hypothetical protein